MDSQKKNIISQVFYNIIVALTVSFVALSLGAAFGLLSGRGAFAGMISAGIIAIITSLLGGTRVQCSGPTAPMTSVIALVVLAAIQNQWLVESGINPDHFVNVVLLLTGLFLIFIAVLRLAKFINLVPNVVISGFMNGIALLIWIDQIKKIFGLGGKEAFRGPIGLNLFVAIATVVFIFIVPKLFKMFRVSFLKFLPSTLVALVIMTGFSQIFNLPIEYIHLSGQLTSLNDVSILVKSQWPQNISWPLLKLAIPFALQLAVLCYLDTLLTSVVVDKMTTEETKPNKELFAQGIGNCAVGLVGGIPGAQATIRSVLMIKEKANLRLAGVMVGVFVLVEMILFQEWISFIPQSVFAGILFKVGYDVFDFYPIQIYLKEIGNRELNLKQNFFSRHDDEVNFVTNREMMMIIGTCFVTVLCNLNAAVGIFTIVFYLHNK
ncbi:Sulfate transporter, partial [hydrothermal vent metagenome]